ncbi:MAG: tetratricopeptide repeat protein [Candidatus Helarchaeota archaeon]|nr:tetratricopeptide repeat protein [Candidatus Helarchaeota archaeon]
MYKKNFFIIWMFLIAVFIVFLTRLNSESTEFNVNKSMVSPNKPTPKSNLKESLDPYFERFDEYVANGNYEEAIAEAKKVIEIAPQDERAYSVLKGIYSTTGRYTEAIEVSKELLEVVKNKGIPICGYLRSHAAILEYDGKQDEAIEFLKGYRRDCPETVKELVNGLNEAKAKGESFFPTK